MIECLYILKVNGKMWLRHRRSEGSFEAYEGLHKWNLDYNHQGELIFWNQKNAVNMSKSLQEIADVKVLPAKEDAPRIEQVFFCEITKKRGFDLDEFLDMVEERWSLVTMVNNLMTLIASYEDKYLKDLPERATE